MKNTLLAIALAGVTFSSFAQADKEPVTKQEFVIPPGMLEKASPEDIAKAQALGAQLAKQMLDTYNSKVTPELLQEPKQVRRFFDDIADAAVAKDRGKVLEFLGIDPEAQTGLYIFLSWSMPLDVLRAYAIEGLWSGATLVFRGVPPGKELGEFVLKDLRSLVYGKGASASISIDPRMFESYQVTAVPTILFTKVKGDFQCQGVQPQSFKYGEQELIYDTCPELNPALYVKMSGAVSTSYALQAFIDHGTPQAGPYLKALARGFANGTVPGKAQVAFTGEWEDVLSPAQQKAALEAAGLLTNMGNVTPSGSAPK